MRNNPAIWRAGDTVNANSALSTGFPELDEALPENGWPRNAVIEVVIPRWGVGELTLLLPLMRHMQRSHRIVWISPPYVPYAPALSHSGLVLEKMLVMPAELVTGHELWILEKVLRTRSCGVAMAWPKKISGKMIRRLQLAAEKGQSFGFIFCQREMASSPAALRIRLTGLRQGLQIDILKVRGACRYPRVVISLQSPRMR